MIVPIRNWAVVRPARALWRAKKVQKSQSAEERASYKNSGLFTEFESMLLHTADLMVRSQMPK